VVKLALVESKLLALEDVAIAATGLAGTAGNDGVETTGLELLLEDTLDLAGGLEAGLLLLGHAVALLGLLNSLALLLLATATEGLAVVGLVPLAERSGIDLDNGRLGEGVGTDELVVGRVIGDDNHTGLAGDALGGPREVTGVETEGTVLVVTATGANGVDALGTDTGVRGLTAQLESSLLPCRAVRKIMSFQSVSCRQVGTRGVGHPARRSGQEAFQAGKRGTYSLREEVHTVVTEGTHTLAFEI
jgi:hypothetical protein